MNIVQIINELLMGFAKSIPNLFGAIIVALIGFIISKSVAKIIERILGTVGIDKVADKLNDIDIISQYNIKIKISSVIANIFYYVLVLIFLIAATELLGMPAVSKLISDIINYIPNAISAMILLVIGILVANIFKNMTHTACTSLGIPSSKLIANFVFYFVFLTTMISALAQAKVDTQFVTQNLSIILAGGVFAFALGYGIASKDMMANFLASFYTRQRFEIGDIISIGDVEGAIIEMDSIAMVIYNNGKKVIIPLHRLNTDTVTIIKSISQAKKFIEGESKED